MKKGSSLILILVLIVAFTAVTIGAYLYGKKSLSVKNLYSGSAPTPQTSANNTIATTDTSPDSQKDGIIKGKLGYPSEFVPSGRVLAQNITTKKVFTLNVEGLIGGKGSDKFAISVPEGKYYLKYEACPSTEEPNNCLSGYYTTNDGTFKNTAHDLIPVSVIGGGSVNDIYIFDFYGPPSTDPGF